MTYKKPQTKDKVVNHSAMQQQRRTIRELKTRYSNYVCFFYLRG